MLTERLAAYCDEVYAIDFSPSACAQARARCACLPQVEVCCAALPEGTPAKDFDLLVLSEIGYYFTPQDWQRVSAALINSIPQGAIVLAAHWLGHSQDHRISGDEVHEILLSHAKLRIEHTERQPKHEVGSSGALMNSSLAHCHRDTGSRRTRAAATLFALRSERPPDAALSCNQ